MKQIIVKEIKGIRGGRWYILRCNFCCEEFKKDYSDITHHNFYFCSDKCKALYRHSNGWTKKGAKSHLWKGGKTIDASGYFRVYMPNHPNNYSGYVLEHRYVFEQYIGRLLNTNEIIHHINNNKKDNRIENLVLLNKVSHANQHHKDRTFNTTRDKVTGRFIHK